MRDEYDPSSFARAFHRLRKNWKAVRGFLLRWPLQQPKSLLHYERCNRYSSSSSSLQPLHGFKAKQSRVTVLSSLYLPLLRTKDSSSEPKRNKEMAMGYTVSLKNIISKEVVRLVGCRTFAAGGGKAKKGSKGGGGGDAPKGSTLSKEVKSSTVVGGNILKDGVDPKTLPDSEYPDWLWHLLDKKPPLSELRRKSVETLPYEELKRFVKLDNRARIKDNNSVRAKN